MPKTASAKKPAPARREPASYVPMGANDAMLIRLNSYVEGTKTRRLRDEAEAIYNQIYPGTLPKPGIGPFIASAIRRGLDEIRKEFNIDAPPED